MTPFRSLRTLWRRVTLRDVLFVTIPLMGFATWLFGASILDYYRLSHYSDWWTIRSSGSASMLGHRLKLARYALESNGFESRLAARRDSTPAIRLNVDQGEWRAITTDVGAHWGTWIDATVEGGAGLQPVEIRPRGDATAHWTTPKKSLSIKAPRGELFQGTRRVNLTVKGVLHQYVSHTLAADMGLLVPETGVVPVFLNERFHGLHRLMGRPDEHFLRRSGRMPGNVFRGEALMKGDEFRCLPRGLFLNPCLWDRTAENDRPGANGDGALFEWIRDLNGSTFAEHERFLTWFDTDELSRLLALMLMCGDPHHMSDWHNQFWYEDPSSGRMHPIVWDLLIRPLEAPLFDGVVTRLWLSLLRDPRIFDRALEHVLEESRDDRILERAYDLAATAEEAHADAVDYDRRRAGSTPPLGSSDAVRHVVRSNLETVRGWAADSQVAFHHASLPDGPDVLDFLARGRAGSVLEALEIEADPAEAVFLWADRNRNGTLDPDDSRVPVEGQITGQGRRLLLEAPERLLPGCTADGPHFRPEPLHYRYFLAGPDLEATAPVASVRPVLRARFSGDELAALPWEADAAIPSARSWHPWQYVEPEARDMHLEGEVRLTEDLRIPEGTTLSIAAGTRLLLDPGVSVLARGRVLARGEEERPITVAPAIESEPWGVFALQGSGADGSVIAGVRFRGGGGAVLERVEYKGSVCVHNTRDVAFLGCDFRANRGCDDLLNVVRADVDLFACTFDQPNADAIDYDMSTGEIRGCRITGAPNDGIDLMTCSPWILDTLITGSGDKGISVGEDSSPLIRDCEISGCKRGFEIKDLSSPVILDTRITGNELGILQRRKSNYYAAGGRAVLAGSVLAGNTVDHEASDRARLTLCGTRIGAGDAASEESAEADWLRELFGEWGSARILDQGQFADGFRDPSGGWDLLGRLGALRVHERELVARFTIDPGALGLAVDWHLPGDGTRHVLVLETRGKGLAEARAAVGDEAAVEATLLVDPDPGIARYTVIELPPGRYEALVLAGTPAEAGAELRLCSWRLLALPPTAQR